jgi:hypothetical protein
VCRKTEVHTIIPGKCDITLTSKGNTTDAAKYVISALQTIENGKNMRAFASVIFLRAASIDRERQKERNEESRKG